VEKVPERKFLGDHSSWEKVPGKQQLLGENSGTEACTDPNFPGWGLLEVTAHAI
jgi:hypothetical protein